jgi:hypothetical protein
MNSQAGICKFRPDPMRLFGCLAIPKLDVAGSIPVSRSTPLFHFFHFFHLL